MVLSFIVFLSLIVVNVSIDANSLQVDRWSAMEVTIKNIVEGVYPYNKLDHLGQTSSNLPGLSLLGLPFYLLGDVGYLQVFVFGVFGGWIYKSKREKKEKVLILILLVLSPAYWWEVFAKSDLMSNVLLLLIFIDFWKEKYSEFTFRKPWLLGILVGFFCLTRGVVLIPLTIMLFYEFVKTELRKKVLFLLGVVVSMFVLILPILLSLEDFYTIIENNPFNHQTKYAPKLLILLALVVPFFLSREFSASRPILNYSMYVLSGLLLSTFLLNVMEEGASKNIYGKAFDLSYLGMLIPFVISSLSSLNNQILQVKIKG
ncbi:hypothetical protein [Tenacibaculum sp. MAR_2009_124]|uniref:hypothetical protein n=1 Tax=Tenacibaculum sp. MAR_2009_124 TaxID=1250059 RepID=UPI00115FD67A|nr:hypothetical protein [Tenacibaculum sp. MAR_2009_124]